MTQKFNALDLLNQDFTQFSLDYENTLVEIVLPDGRSVEMEGKWVFPNLMFWKPYLTRGVAVDLDRHLIHGIPLTNSVRERIHTDVVDDFRDVLTPAQFDELTKELADDVNEIFNLAEIYFGSCHRSISIPEIGEALEIPELAAAIKINISKERRFGIKAVEEKYEAAFGEILKVFSTPHPKNIFFPFLSLGAFNTKQFTQVVGAGGTRTDVDESMLLMPIQNSYLQGYRNICEYAADSLSAKKSHFYNDREMSNTQYTNRKQQLLASTLRTIYPGDCGTTILVSFKIQAKFKSMVLGKNIVLDDGSMVMLTKKNIDLYKDKTVNMRSVMTCRYQDGYCLTCAGGLAKHFPHGTLPGILSAIEVMSPVAQQVLSNKHVSKTRASEYRIPEDLRSWFVCSNNEVYFREDVDPASILIAMPLSDVDRLSDLEFVEGTSLNDQYFSKLTTMFIAREGSFEPLTMEVNLLDRNQSNPYLSSDLLRMVKSHPESVMMAEAGSTSIVYVSMKHFPKDKPVMRAVVVNDSTRQFVKRVETMFSHQIAQFTDCGDALREVTNVIWDRASPHLLHLETMLRASMITSPIDYGIPQLTSTECRFAPLPQIIPRREIETQLAFERWSAWITNAESFILPKRSGAFTPFLHQVPRRTEFAA